LVGVLNAILPPIIAALRVPATLLIGFLAVLALDAVILLLVSDIDSGDFKVDSFGWALLAALVMAAASLVLQTVLGVNDEDSYSLRVIERVARRQGERTETDVPGILFLEIDGLAAAVLRRAMRDGNAPVLASWMAHGSHQMIEWETDLSSQTGASQAGILLGSNENIPAFRWVEKETGRVMTCSAPADCAEIERRLATGRGLLINGGSSRGNLLSGEADEVILTVSRMDAEKRANPGYRAFLANGFNVTRELVLFFYEVGVEVTAAVRQRRRDVLPRGERGGRYPFLRAALCVGVRDLIVYGVLTDMMRGRPAVYATFSSYDEVAHHSGLERVDTLEALRKLDQQIGRIARARRYAPRPYELVVLSDHGQTQGATFKQRNGYGLDELVQRSLEHGSVSKLAGGDEHQHAVSQAVNEASGRAIRPESHGLKDDARAIVLGSGNLGLVYLMEAKHRLSAEEIYQRHPRLIPALAEHPDIGYVLLHSSEHGAIATNARGTHYLTENRVQGEDPLSPFSPNAPAHLLRTSNFEHVADIMIGSYYDPELEQACAFEELISFHGGLGGTQTAPFVLHPVHLPTPPHPLTGAAQIHELLSGWRDRLQAQPMAEPSGATSRNRSTA
jgi:Mycobacterial 4 TMS phage holin, superfamily IV/Type I phosphodiesterase / nucleotide pyrophosphatase